MPGEYSVDEDSTRMESTHSIIINSKNKNISILKKQIPCRRNDKGFLYLQFIHLQFTIAGIKRSLHLNNHSTNGT